MWKNSEKQVVYVSKAVWEREHLRLTENTYHSWSRRKNWPVNKPNSQLLWADRANQNIASSKRGVKGEDSLAVAFELCLPMSWTVSYQPFWDLCDFILKWRLSMWAATMKCEQSSKGAKELTRSVSYSFNEAVCRKQGWMQLFSRILKFPFSFKTADLFSAVYMSLSDVITFKWFHYVVNYSNRSSQITYK